MSGNDHVNISACAIHWRITRTHPSTGWTAVPCEREMHGSTSQVNFLLSVGGVKFYDLRSAGAECGTKLKLVKEPPTPHDPLCVVAWVPGIPVEQQCTLS